MIGVLRRFYALAVIAILNITLASLAPAQLTTAGVDKSGRVPTTRSQTGLFGGVALEQQAPLFLPAVMYDSDWSGDGSLAVADVNGDGKADMVVAAMELSSGNGLVDVLLGNGDGTFRPAGGQSSGGRQTASVAVADVNGDGKPDILVANFCTTTCTDGSGVVGVLLGNGEGTFQPVVTYGSGGGYSVSIAVADVNGDGKPDMLVANENASGVSVLLGNGDGTFKSAVTCDAGLNWARSVQVADLNGDGRPDLSFTAYDSGSNTGVIGVLIGNGDGTFQPTVTYRTAGYESGLVRVSDVNGDHKPDLVTMLCISGTNDCSTSRVGVLMGNGDGTFQPAVTSPASGYYVGLSAATDFNGDGKPDVLIFNREDEAGGSGALGVMQGNGDGTFQLPVLYSAGLPLSPGAADVNGDGKPDALVMSGCSGHGCVGAMLNNAGAFRPTTTVLLTSLNPSVFGQTITFMATVSSPSGAPTGIVELLDGSTSLGSATLVNGTASITVSSLAAGSHSITAWYPLSGDFGGSTSTPIIQVVNTAVTQTTLVSSVNPVGVRQYVEYTASIASQYGGAATGEVAFQDAGWIVRVTVAGNQAKFRTYYTNKGSGAHSILASYQGDISNIGSTALPLIEYVGDFPVSSKVQVTTSGSPSVVGQPVTFTASVRPAYAKYGAIPDGELVWFYDGTTVLGSVALVGGRAEYTTSALSARAHSINATYAGDSIFKPAADVITQIVNKNTTTTTLHSNPNPSAHGQAVTFTVKVKSPGPLPTGKVKFMDGTTAIGSATLSGGVATLTKSNLAVGTHSITAQYAGDANYAKSTSPVLNQVVAQ